ncbi:MAG: hypothetical protein LUG50_15755 [Planctomycetaceae bacterium]|nr:hypothetical protein [Planctomycetaceae bacterium]
MACSYNDGQSSESSGHAGIQAGKNEQVSLHRETPDPTSLAEPLTAGVHASNAKNAQGLHKDYTTVPPPDAAIMPLIARLLQNWSTLPPQIKAGIAGMLEGVLGTRLHNVYSS